MQPQHVNHDAASVFCALPTQCLCSILSFLPPQNLVLHASLVCQQWRQALQHPMCWTRIDVRHVDVSASLISLKRSWPAIFGARSCITSVELYQKDDEYHPPSYSATACGDLAANVINDLSAMKNKLRSLSLLNFHEFTGGLPIAWPNLVQLELFGGCDYTCLDNEQTTYQLDLSACPSLEKLRVDSAFERLILIIRGLAHLSELNICCELLEEIDGLFNLPSLSHLTIRHAEDAKPRLAEFSEKAGGNNTAITCAHMPRLLSVDLKNTTGEIADVFLRNTSCMPNVENVKLPCGVHLPEPHCMATLRSLSSLTVEGWRLTETEMRAIGSVPSLHTLKFRGFCGPYTNDEHVLASSFPLHILCDMPGPQRSIKTLKFNKCEALVCRALQSIHMLSALHDLSLTDCDRIGPLPSTLSRCNSLNTLTLDESDTTEEPNPDFFLSLQNAQIIADIPHLRDATLPPPSSQECVQAIARCPELHSVNFDGMNEFPREWLSCLPPALQASHVNSVFYFEA